MDVFAAWCYFHKEAAAGINSSLGGARQMKGSSVRRVSHGLRVTGLYLPAVDNYWARATPVALVNLSARKEERKDSDQAAAADGSKEEETPASSSLSPKQHHASRGS